MKRLRQKDRNPLPLSRAMENELKVSVKLKGKSIDWMKWYCEQVDMTPAQVLRSAFAEKVSQFLNVPTGTPQGHQEVIQEKPVVSPQGHQPRTRTGEDKDLSEDKSSSSDDKCREFFKSFIGRIDYKKFPERVSKEIKNQWKAIVESKLTSKEMAEAYNHYVSESKKNDSIPSHPNSWIAGHGWANTEGKKDESKYDQYDF